MADLVPVAVLRALVSTPRVPPVVVIFHEPSRQLSAEVVVVAGADGAAPVGLTAGDPELADVASLMVGLGAPVSDGGADAVSPAGAVDVGPVLEDADGPPGPICPHTAPAMTPTTAVMASATTTIAPAGIEPRAPRRRVVMPPA